MLAKTGWLASGKMWWEATLQNFCGARGQFVRKIDMDNGVELEALEQNMLKQIT